MAVEVAEDYADGSAGRDKLIIARDAQGRLSRNSGGRMDLIQNGVRRVPPRRGQETRGGVRLATAFAMLHVR